MNKLLREYERNLTQLFASDGRTNEINAAYGLSQLFNSMSSYELKRNV